MSKNSALGRYAAEGNWQNQILRIRQDRIDFTKDDSTLSITMYAINNSWTKDSVVQFATRKNSLVRTGKVQEIINNRNGTWRIEIAPLETQPKQKWDRAFVTALSNPAEESYVYRFPVKEELEAKLLVEVALEKRIVKPDEFIDSVITALLPLDANGDGLIGDKEILTWLENAKKLVSTGNLDFGTLVASLPGELEVSFVDFKPKFQEFKHLVFNDIPDVLVTKNNKGIMMDITVRDNMLGVAYDVIREKASQPELRETLESVMRDLRSNEQTTEFGKRLTCGISAINHLIGNVVVDRLVISKVVKKKRGIYRLFLKELDGRGLSTVNVGPIERSSVWITTRFQVPLLADM